MIWFTDSHGSRFDAEFLQRLLDKGVCLFESIPNTTSKCQSKDVSIFGKFKTSLGKHETSGWEDGRGGKDEAYEGDIGEGWNTQQLLRWIGANAYVAFHSSSFERAYCAIIGNRLVEASKLGAAYSSLKNYRSMPAENVSNAIEASMKRLADRGLPFDVSKVWLSEQPNNEDLLS